MAAAVHSCIGGSSLDGAMTFSNSFGSCICGKSFANICTRGQLLHMAAFVADVVHAGSCIRGSFPLY